MQSVLVMMSTYNGGRYLREQLNSILIQKGIALDIMIRDDMSTDDTKSILDEYKKKNKNISVIYGKNVGACQSFFELMKNAKLKYNYYAFCDQDDVWMDDKLITGINRLSDVKNDKPSLYYSGQTIVDDNLDYVCDHKIDIERSVFANFIFNQAAGCTIIFNKKLMVFLKKYTPSNIFGHDVWCYKLCAALDGNIIPDIAGKIFYRQHSNNVVGINNSLIGKLKRAKKYIFQYSSSSYACELMKGYSKCIGDEWMSFINNIVKSNGRLKNRILLLKDKKIKFKSFNLRIIFIIKVLLRKI